jgi:peptidoglycan-N-acetylglucosamine deacetylase
MWFRFTNIIASALLVTLLLVNYFFAAIPWWGFALLILGYVSVVFWGCISISSGFFLPVLCRAKTNEQAVALTFDDGPNPIFTTQILDTLQKQGVPATFFCIGKNIAGNEPLMQRIKDDGHITGNHSYSHDFWFDMFGSNKMLADMQQMDKEVLRATGLKPLLFRPPYGVTNPNVRRAVNKGKYIPIGWSIRSLDTIAKDKQKLLSRITGNMKAGDIILLHDCVEMTANILPELIEEINKRGFKIVALDKMLHITAYA